MSTFLNIFIYFDKILNNEKNIIFLAIIIIISNKNLSNFIFINICNMYVECKHPNKIQR